MARSALEGLLEGLGEVAEQAGQLVGKAVEVAQSMHIVYKYD